MQGDDHDEIGHAQELGLPLSMQGLRRGKIPFHCCLGPGQLFRQGGVTVVIGCFVCLFSL